MLVRTALLATLISVVAWADSPLTSIDFAAAYGDLPAVKGPREKQLAFLTQASAPNDQKLAVMSALGWESGDNHVLFGKLLEKLRPGDFTASDRFVAGYLLALDDYLELKARGLEGKTASQLLDEAALGAQVVAGTQGGVVVWQADATNPVATRPGFICSGLAFGDAVFVGCDAEVVRWDGKSFKSYLKREQAKNTAQYYKPMRGPNGALWVRLGAKLWLYDAVADRFQQVTAPWKSDVYDAAVRANGETWVIDFLRALQVDGKTIALQSPTYPGRDPRRFRVDGRGTLWVEDFESGLFRYDEATKAFVKESGLDAKASGVVRDEARARFIFLHYTDGLVVKPDQGAASKVDLRELQYMRDLLLDENGDVWVAGWTGLMRLRPDGPSFGRQRYEVK